MHSDVTYTNKYKPKMLSTIELKNLQIQEITEVRSLCKALTDTKRISSLIVIDPYSNYENFTRIGHLLKITNRWKNLTLKLIDEEGVFLNKEKLKRVARLKRCKDLSSLNLSLKCCSQTENKLLKSLSQQLRGLSNIKSLTIDASFCYLNEDDDENEDEDEEEDDNENEDKKDDINTPILKFKYPRSLSRLHLNFQETSSIDPQLPLIFASNIQRCNSLNHIDLDLQALYYQMENSEDQIWTSLAEKTSSLKTLTVNKTLYPYDFEKTKAYLDSFKHLQSLTDLSINFYFSLSEENSQILSTIFFNHLASLINLKSLNLNLSCRKDHFSFLHLFTLQSFSQLEHLRLDFGWCINIDNQFLQDLGSTLPSLSRLQNFELTLPNSNITHEGVIALFSNLKHLSQLKNLCLSLIYIRTDHETLEILSNNIANLKLTSLKIILSGHLEKPKSFLQKFSALWEPEKRLTSLFSALYGFNSSLEDLSLTLAGFDVCTKELKHFSLVLKELKQLKSLFLQLPQFDSGNNYEGLRKLLSSLKEVQKLNSLRLNFRGAKLSKKEVELISLHLRDFSQNIEDLTLSFENTDKLGNEILGFIGLGLQSLLSLKTIAIVFGHQKTFSHEAVFDLSKKLTNLKSLEDFTLYIKLMRDYTKIREIGLYIKNHQNLKNLTRCIVNENVLI